PNRHTIKKESFTQIYFQYVLVGCFATRVSFPIFEVNSLVDSRKSIFDGDVLIEAFFHQKMHFSTIMN
ncbi:MAG: hypothetical protein KAV87_31870, partial [Desulfobacteraceae bacterium]|nr:hypothetical protein [Desulfobacteraceae bacterium]